MPALPSFITLYRELIAEPTMSSLTPLDDHSNQALINRLAQWLTDLGFAVQLLPVAGSRNKVNLLAQRGHGDGGLLLSGHTDTVPCDLTRWNSDPWTLTEADNRFYGLGVIDMKGFFAFVIDTLRTLDLRQLQKPLYILATADEETTMSGARAFSATTTAKPDFVVIGEPTSLRPINMNKGYIADCIRISGRSGHSSDPDAGLNAIEVMQQVLTALLSLRDTLKSQYQNARFEIPYPTMNLGHIHGGDAVNRICPACELQLDIRPLPGMAPEDLEALLAAALAPIRERYPDAIEIESLFPPVPGFATDVNSPLVQLAEKLTGETARAVNYATEAPFLQQLGAQTIVLGPGSIAQAHRPNEYLETRMIQPTLTLLEQLITQICLRGE